MGVKMDALRKFRFECDKKWDSYFENGGHVTPETIEQMRADDNRIAELSKEAWEEQKEERNRKEVSADG